MSDKEQLLSKGNQRQTEAQQRQTEAQQQQTEAQAVKHLIELSQTPRAGRTCALQITNHSRNSKLKDPIVIMKEGCVRSPAKKIPVKSEGVLVVMNRAWRRQGTSGLVSYCYAIDEDERRFVIFWNVPKSGPNMFGICLTTLTSSTSEEMKEKILKTKLTTFLQRSSNSSSDIKKKEAATGTELEITSNDRSLSAAM